MVAVRELSPPPVNVNETLRYARCAKPSGEVMKLLQEALCEAEPVLTYKAAYTRLPLKIEGDVSFIGDTRFESKNLAKNLHGCDEAILFAATLGVGIDRLIARYSKISPAKALMLQAIGAERIEALCDALEEEIKSTESVVLKPRFSPGYGDLSLDYQCDLSDILNMNKNLGVCLNSSMLLSPSKSVTAIVGVIKKTN